MPSFGHIARALQSTHNIAMIQPPFTCSKWNMSEIFGLNFPISYTVSEDRVVFIIHSRRNSSYLFQVVSNHCGYTPRGVMGVK